MMEEIIAKIIGRLLDEKAHAENTAEELIQERDNPDDADKYWGKAEAYQHSIEIIISSLMEKVK